MTPFDLCWAFLQRPDIEGGARISRHPDDPGGATRFGISQRAYTGEDIEALTEERARVLFCRDYWDVIHADDLPPAMAIALADAAFNQGPETAIRLLQRALGVAVDGVVGPVTIAAAHAGNGERINEFLSRRLVRYAELGTTFRRGWFLRVLRLKDALQGVV